MLIILEGVAMCFILLMVCIIGIQNGPVGAVYFFEPEVQQRVVQLGLTTKAKIKRDYAIAGAALFLPVLILVPAMVYFVNGARTFGELFWQMTAVLMIMTLTAHICSVFSYKLRFLQARVCIITALLALGMQVWFFMDFLKFRNDMVFSITMVFPLVMTILDVMAARNSLVDEMTVSAVRSVRKIRRRR